MFDDHREGNLYIYDYPGWEEPYVIGADVSLGVGQDYSVAVVLFWHSLNVKGMNPWDASFVIIFICSSANLEKSKP